jgi:uncharacterized membrane protein
VFNATPDRSTEVIMRHFAFRPSLTLRGRENRGLRGLAGKPLHPPLTDVPVTAYLFVAVFDVVSLALGGSHPSVARQLYMAAGWTILGGAGASLLTAITGWADWAFSSEPGTQARRTINAHAITMITVTLLVLADLLIRFVQRPDAGSTPPAVLGLSLAAALLVVVGATLGGSLVYDYGFNVETAGDHPIWHRNERDILPGGHDLPVEIPTGDAAIGR